MTHNNITLDESRLLLQLLMDRLLKALIKNEGKRAPSTCDAPAPPLNQMEQNAVMYMAGYVAASLLKKYKRSTKKVALQKKNDLFVQVLSKMKASHQPGDMDSLADYTRTWSNLVDRGGLFHISNEVARLFESIEMVVRRHLEVSHVSSQSSAVSYGSAGLNFRGFRGLAILHENCSLIRIICYNVQRFKGVASGKQSFREHCATKCF